MKTPFEALSAISSGVRDLVEIRPPGRDNPSRGVTYENGLERK